MRTAFAALLRSAPGADQGVATAGIRIPRRTNSQLSGKDVLERSKPEPGPTQMQDTLVSGWFWPLLLSSKQALTVQTHPMTKLTWPRHATKYHCLLILNSTATSKQPGSPLPSNPTRDQLQPQSHGRVPAHGAAKQETRVCQQLRAAGQIMQGHASWNALPALPSRGKGRFMWGWHTCDKRSLSASHPNRAQLSPLLHSDTSKVSHGFGRLHVAVKIASRSKRQQLLPT